MSPILSNSDYTILRELIKNLPRHQRTKEILPLSEELDKAGIVPDDQLEADIIRIGSEVEVEEILSGQRFRFTIVLPPMADIAKKRISILAPMGIALIGFRKDNEVAWDMPAGTKRFRIVHVQHQAASNPG